MQPNALSDARSKIDIALGGLIPIFGAAGLVAVRDHVARTNVALILAVVVVAAGAFGGRAAGMVAGMTAAASFDFFHTRPYLSLLIHDADDVEMTVLLVILGMVSGRLAWKAGVYRRHRETRQTSGVVRTTA